MTESAAGRTGKRRWEEGSRPTSCHLPGQGPAVAHFTKKTATPENNDNNYNR